MSRFQSFTIPTNNDTLACATKAATVAMSGTGGTILVSNTGSEAALNAAQQPRAVKEATP